MTTQTAVTRERVGIIRDLGRPDANGKCKIAILHSQQDGTPLKFPTLYNNVPDADLTGLAMGQQVTVVVRKGRLKTDGNPNDDLRGYFWDYEAIRSGTMAAPQATAKTAPAGHQEPLGAAPAAEELFPPLPVAQENQERVPEKEREPHYDSRDLSIQRQVALKAAVELAGHRVAGGQPPLGSVEVMQVAEVFSEFLKTGKAPEPAQKGG